MLARKRQLKKRVHHSSKKQVLDKSSLCNHILKDQVVFSMVSILFMKSLHPLSLSNKFLQEILTFAKIAPPCYLVKFSSIYLLASKAGNHTIYFPKMSFTYSESHSFMNSYAGEGTNKYGPLSFFWICFLFFKLLLTYVDS